MTHHDFDKIMNMLHKELKVPPNWVKDQIKEKIAIGTSMSIFNQMRVLSGLNKFSADDVQNVLLECLSKNDQELLDHETQMWKIYGQHIGGEYKLRLENTHYIVPKLCLLLAVMRQAEFEQVKFFEANGNCAALLTD